MGGLVMQDVRIVRFDMLVRSGKLAKATAADEGMNMLTKPEKVFFHNTNLMYCLTPKTSVGTLRETYLASQLAVGHQLSMPEQGDLVADGKWLFEVGGKSKGFSQIKGVENRFVVSDNIEIGYDTKIPLWLFGLLY